MSFSPLCFLHAANVFLDRQLEGTGPLPDDVRPLVEDATLTAFGRIVDLAVERQVDFVLLVGNTFDANDHSIRARAALRDGFQRLAEQQIPVYVLPGIADPLDAWQHIPERPDNVVLLGEHSGSPLPVFRDDRVIATVQGPGPSSIRSRALTERPADSPGGLPAEDGSSETDDWGPITLGLRTAEHDAPPWKPSSEVGLSDEVGNRLRAGLWTNRPEGRSVPAGTGLLEDLSPEEVDYLALGGAGPRQTVTTQSGIAHHPGNPQPLSPQDTGGHGCSLVEIDAEGRVQCTLHSTAAVQWERFSMRVHSESGEDELLADMRTALSNMGPTQGVDVRLIQWTIRGHGPLFDSLFEEERQRTLAAGLQDGNHEENQASDRALHTFRLIPVSRSDTAPLDESSSQEDVHGGFAAEYFDRLAAPDVLAPETIEEFLRPLQSETRNGDGGTPHTALHTALQELASTWDREAILGQARRFGETWFAPASTEGSDS